MSNITKFEEKKQEIDYYKTLAAIAAKSGTTQMSPETILNIMLTAKDLGISPLKALNGGFYVVNGKISMSTAMMADRIRKEGHSIKIPEWTSQKCVIIGIRKDNDDSVKFEFTMDDAHTAGLTNSPTWKKFPKQMLYNRAMATLARTLFPDVVGNAYSEDERHDIENIPPERRPFEDPDVMHPITLETEVKAPEQLFDSPVEALKEILELDNIDSSHLDAYLKGVSEKKKQTVEEIAQSALLKEVLPKFKEHYMKKMSQLSGPSSEVAI